MSHPDKGADISSSCTSVSPRRCLMGITLAITLCVSGGTALAIHHSRSHGLMAHIHHGLVVCTADSRNTLAQTVSQPHPAMVRMAVSSGPDGQIIAGPQAAPLASVLTSAYKADTLLMLDLNQANARNVTQLVRKAHMRDRVILVTSTRKSLEDALTADSQVMIAVPIHSEQEAHAVHRLAKHHPYAAYLSASATPDLFAAAHRGAEAIITEPPVTSKVSTADFLADKPVDIVVMHPSATLPRTEIASSHS